MITYKKGTSKDKWGIFEESERNLVKEQENYLKRRETLDNRKIYIDCDIMEYNYFLKKIKEIVKIEDGGENLWLIT